MSFLPFVVSCVALCCVTACGSDSSAGSSSGSKGRECKTSPGSSSFAAGVAAETGNGCEYTLSLGGQEVATGTCNLGGLAANVSVAPGGTQLFLQGAVDKADDASGLYRKFSLEGTGAGSWADRAGKGFGASASYLQGPNPLNSSSSILAQESDPNFLSADCKVSGTLDSARDVCVFGTNEQYEVHGTLDGTCEGMAGSAISSDQFPEMTIHVKL